MNDHSLHQQLAELQARLAVAEARIEAEAQRADRAEAESLCDPLTGLFNRRGWDRLLAAEENRCRRYAHTAAIVAIDLDGLKSINDQQGHAAGDDLLRRTARALRTLLRASDGVARVGGDEFAILAVECDEAAVATVVDRLAAALAEAGVSASLGAATWIADESLIDTWRRADEAMYAKRSRG